MTLDILVKVISSKEFIEFQILAWSFISICFVYFFVFPIWFTLFWKTFTKIWILSYKHKKQLPTIYLSISFTSVFHLVYSSRTINSSVFFQFRHQSQYYLHFAIFDSLPTFHRFHFALIFIHYSLLVAGKNI